MLHDLLHHWFIYDHIILSAILLAIPFFPMNLYAFSKKKNPCRNLRGLYSKKKSLFDYKIAEHSDFSNYLYLG
jgi:hypothetical protein